MSKKKAGSVYSLSILLAFEFPFGSGNKDGVDGTMKTQRWWGWFWEAMQSYEKNQNPSPVIFKIYKNWHIPLNLSELQFCYLYRKLFQRISVTIKWDSDGKK